MAKILLSAITFEANHGVTSAERAGTRPFEVDVSIEAAVDTAELSDQLSDTIDYQAIAATVVRIGTGDPHHLLESLAREMLNALAQQFPHTRIELELRKLSPPACAGHPRHAAVRLCTR